MADEDGIWEILCSFDKAVRIFSVFIFFFLVLTAFSFPAVEPGTPEYAVTVWNLAIIAIALVVVGVFYVKCDMGDDRP